MMELEFVPVEEFYFALTLAVKTLVDIDRDGLSQQVKARLEEICGQASTVAAASQNTFNYVFKVSGVDVSPADQLAISVADWQGKLRLSSDYGWMLDRDRKPMRTDKYPQREEFEAQLRAYLTEWLGIEI
jgi:hypothetical protein